MKVKYMLIAVVSFIILIFLGSCGGSTNEDMADSGRTQRTENLLSNLRKLATEKGYLFGHQDSPMYGAGWRGADDKSDIKEVTSDYPALMGFDLGHLEIDKDKNLDDVPFDSMRIHIIKQFNRGGAVTISWHPDNPLSGGTAWVTDSLKNVECKTIDAILEGGEKNELFNHWLDKVADFINSLQTEEGVKIPVIFRPWHENMGSWFWWGRDWCTPEQYKDLWELTRKRFDEKHVNNVIWAYSPNRYWGADLSNNLFSERYPGDDLVDIIGWDQYCNAEEDDSVGFYNFSVELDSSLNVLCQFAKQHDKLPALTETGSEGIKADDFWTKSLLPVLNKYPIAYVLVWRNAPHDKPGHFYVPYIGHPSVSDFIKFYNDKNTLFLRDINGLYLNKETKTE